MMRRLIDIVTNPETLMEAQRYEDMFNAILKAAKVADERYRAKYANYKHPDPTDHPDEELQDIIDDRATGDYVTREVKKKIDQELAWAKATLKRQDRITWYLRFSRLRIAAMPYEEFNPLYHRYKAEYAQKSGKPIETDVGDFENFRHPATMANFRINLAHYLSLPIHGIQTFVFNHQPWMDIANHFADLEREWQEARKHSLKPRAEDEILIDCGDGWAWWKLPRAHCRDEGDAMGHCGNSPRSDTDDEILSLRKKIDVDGHEFWKPYCTFILTSDGDLTEMKGRFNKKPGKGEKPEIRDLIHKHIQELLHHDIVQGIVGGGHAAHENFSLNDLSDEERKELMMARPELGSAYEYFEYSNKLDKFFVNKLEKEMEEYLGRSGDVEKITGERIVVSTWQDVGKAVEEVAEDHDIQTIAKMAQGDFEYFSLIDESKSSPYHDLSEEIEDFIHDDPKLEDMIIDAGYENASHFLARRQTPIRRLCDAMQTRLTKLSTDYCWHWLQLKAFDGPTITFTKEEDYIVASANPKEVAAGLHDIRYAGDYAAESDEGYSMTIVQSEGWFHTREDSEDDYMYNSQYAENNGVKRPDDLLREIHDLIMMILRKHIVRICNPKDLDQLSFDF